MASCTRKNIEKLQHHKAYAENKMKFHNVKQYFDVIYFFNFIRIQKDLKYSSNLKNLAINNYIYASHKFLVGGHSFVIFYLVTVKGFRNSFHCRILFWFKRCTLQIFNLFMFQVLANVKKHNV